jgi:hypothetical protein
VNAFMSTLDFSTEQTNEEIDRILRAHPNTVQKYYEDLVVASVADYSVAADVANDGGDPDADAQGGDFDTYSITHEEFWTRYFYRCNAERVSRQWHQEQEERSQARKAAAAALANGAKQGWGMARNLMGNAMKVVAPVFEEGAEQSTETTAAILQSFVAGNRGRPPFVLRSTDSADEDEEEEEEEDEEELGWDDDDDDDDAYSDVQDDEGDGDTTMESEEIVFDRHNENEATLEDLDQLHHTIAIQRLEIEKLSAKCTDAAPDLVKEEQQPLDDVAIADEVQTLQMTLFEKDAEIAALRAKVEDNHEYDGDGDEMNDNTDTHQKAELEQELTSLQDKLQTLESTLLAKDTEIASLKEGNRADQIIVAPCDSEKEETAAANAALVASLQTQLQVSEQNLIEVQACLQANSKTYQEDIQNVNTMLDNAVQSKSAVDRKLVEQESMLEQTHMALAQLQEDLEATRQQVSLKAEQVANLEGELKLSTLSTQSLAPQHSDKLKEEEHENEQEQRLQLAPPHHDGSPNSSLSSAVNVESMNMLASPVTSETNLASSAAPEQILSPLATTSSESTSTSRTPNTNEEYNRKDDGDEDDWGDDGW